MSSPLNALSPLDGRYAGKTRPLQEHFSEFALIRERVAIEIAWLLALAAEPSFAALKPFSAGTVDERTRAADGLKLRGAERPKALEAANNHPLEAGEYSLAARFPPDRGVTPAPE